MVIDLKALGSISRPASRNRITDRVENECFTRGHRTNLNPVFFLNFGSKTYKNCANSCRLYLGRIHLNPSVGRTAMKADAGYTPLDSKGRNENGARVAGTPGRLGLLCPRDKCEHYDNPAKYGR